VLALSANSPYWCGFDTGLHSARGTIFESLPNTGMPTAFDSYADFDRFEQYMLETDSIADRGELWFDVRPHSGLGTVEVRVADAQRDPDLVLQFVEYVRALVVDLAERYEDGESSSDYRRELLDECKWRAIRHGHDTALLSQDFETTRPLKEVVQAEADRLDVPGLVDLYERESGASRQRRLRETEDQDALREALILERS
jgi:carboxylate-amine ligase